jgi:FMN phosphatase YigB (HAD superfamily)
MKLFLYVILTFFSHSAVHGFISAKPPAASTIIETPHFNDLRLYADSDTLVLLDIDDTLLIPAQTLGSDVWFQYQWKVNKDLPDPLDTTLAQWEAIRHLSRMETVEQNTAEIVSDLQKKNYRIMGLTTQGLALATRTVQQLLDNGIDLMKTAPSQEEIYLMNERGVLYRHGVLFTSGTPKGPALEKLLKAVNLRPKKIVFINDKESHLLDVAESAKKLDIDFIGLRYSYSDERVSHFSPELAEVQFHFSTISHLLSDEEAQYLLERLHESS